MKYVLVQAIRTHKKSIFNYRILVLVKRLLFHDYPDAAISRVFLARQQRIDSNGVSYQLKEANPQDYNGKCKIS